MPENLWPWLLFPAVGALIGAVTNQIAIKMLFRPYRAWTVVGRRVPFTPGVIPAQRHVIAENIASTFEAQLLSGAEIHALLTGERATRILSAEVDKMLSGLGPLAALAGGFKPMILEKLIEAIEGFVSELNQSGDELDIGSRIEAKINAMDIALLEELVLGFSREQFRHITFFGGVLGFLIGLVQAALSILLG